MKFNIKPLETIQDITITEYQMQNDALDVRFINIGGALTKIAMASDNYEQNLVLNYENPVDYLNNGYYLNAIVGRTANRIKNGQFEIDGKTYQVDINNGPNNLHGGAENLTHAVWNVEQMETGYRLTTSLPAQIDGFPGNLDVTTLYELDGDQFKITFKATTDAATIVNLTHHAYFNLSGNLQTNINNHEVMLEADYVAEIDEAQAFTQNLVPVKNTIFDFTTPTVIDASNKVATPLFEKGFGYDHCYIFNNIGKVATVKDSVSNRQLTVYTDAPSAQFYCGNFITEETMFENNRRGEKHLGLCIEPHYVPYDISTQILRPGDVYEKHVTFQFTKA
ncbi:MAG TPA: galactose mutarotase [Firmicutes bacterium]|nr:galactose mutarotase [Bacillota bacterium]